MSKYFLLVVLVMMMAMVGCATTGSGTTYHYRNGQSLPAGATVVEYNRGGVTPIGVTPVPVVGPVVSHQVVGVTQVPTSRGVPVYTYPDPRDQVRLREQDLRERESAHRRALDWRRQVERERAEEARRKERERYEQRRAAERALKELRRSAEDIRRAAERARSR